MNEAIANVASMPPLDNKPKVSNRLGCGTVGSSMVLEEEKDEWMFVSIRPR